MFEKDYQFRKNEVEKDLLIHSIHAYPAKFIPKIPRYFIKKYSKEQDRILDPFCGCGTTLTEAYLLKRNSCGIDINPLAILISKVKSNPLPQKTLIYSFESLKNKLKEDLQLKNEIEFPNALHWFEPDVLDNLIKIKTAIDSLNDKNSAELFRIALSCSVRKVSKADMHIWQPLITKFAKQLGSKKDLFEVFNTNCIKVMEANEQFYKYFENNSKEKKCKVSVFNEDSRKIKLEDGSVDLIVTSPPYINAQEYLRINKLEMFILNLITPEDLLNANKTSIGTEYVKKEDYKLFSPQGKSILNKICKKIFLKDSKKSYIVYKFFQDMELVMKECFRVLKPNGRFVVAIGNNHIKGVLVKSNEILLDLGKNLGFQVDETGYDIIQKRALMRKRHFTKKYMNKEWIIVFKKAV